MRLPLITEGYYAGSNCYGAWPHTPISWRGATGSAPRAGWTDPALAVSSRYWNEKLAEVGRPVAALDLNEKKAIHTADTIATTTGVKAIGLVVDVSDLRW